MSERPLRAGFVIDELRPGAGTENQLLHLLDNFDRSVVEPHVCCLRQDAEIDSIASASPVEVLRVEKILSPRGLGAFLRLRRWVKDRRLDVLVTFFRDANIVGTIGGSIAGPVVVSSRRNLGYWQTPLELSVLRLLNVFTGGFVANSEAAREQAAAAERIDISRIAVIPNAIDTRRFFPPSDARRNAVRRRLGLPLDAFVVGSVANHRPVKNLPLLLRAFARSLETVGAARLLLIGDGPQRAELEVLACKLGAGARVSFLGRRSDVDELLAALDCGVLSSDSESQSNALLEFMAAGIPVVASDNPGNRELLQSGRFGRLFDCRDESSLSELLVETAQDDVARHQLALAGRRYIETTHAVDAIVDAWQRYLEVVARKGFS